MCSEILPSAHVDGNLTELKILPWNLISSLKSNLLFRWIHFAPLVYIFHRFTEPSQAMLVGQHNIGDHGSTRWADQVLSVHLSTPWNHSRPNCLAIPLATLYQSAAILSSLVSSRPQLNKSQMTVIGVASLEPIHIWVHSEPAHSDDLASPCDDW